MNIKPWDQQLDEPAKAFAAFRVYRDMGLERSIGDTSMIVFPPREGARKNKIVGQIAKWASEFRWVERAKAYDRELDRRALDEQVREIVRMNRRHADIARLAMEKGLAKLRNVNPDELSAGDVVRLLGEAIKWERLAMGVHEKSEKLTIQLDNSEDNTPQHTPDQAAQILSILADAGVIPQKSIESNIIDVEIVE